MVAARNEYGRTWHGLDVCGRTVRHEAVLIVFEQQSLPTRYEH